MFARKPFSKKNNCYIITILEKIVILKILQGFYFFSKPQNRQCIFFKRKYTEGVCKSYEFVQQGADEDDLGAASRLEYCSHAGRTFWYIYKRMVGKGAFMLMLSLATAGIGIIPVWIYCGFKGNSDFYRYLKHKGVYIYD
ncbi:MAG TPA: hypothetical protein DCZ10_12375 [Pelotomaculum sp.]|nr:hypothetical protein [Pelotomaculum sp.]